MEKNSHKKTARINRLVLLQQIVQQLSAAPDLQAASRIIVARVKEALHTDVCSAYLVDPATGTLVLTATEGLRRSDSGTAQFFCGRRCRLGLKSNYLCKLNKKEEAL